MRNKIPTDDVLLWVCIRNTNKAGLFSSLPGVRQHIFYIHNLVAKFIEFSAHFVSQMHFRFLCSLSKVFFRFIFKFSAVLWGKHSTNNFLMFSKSCTHTKTEMCLVEMMLEFRNVFSEDAGTITKRRMPVKIIKTSSQKK